MASFRTLCFTVMLYNRKEFNIEVLKKFISLQDFKGKILVDALRYIVCALLHNVCIWKHLVLVSPLYPRAAVHCSFKMAVALAVVQNGWVDN